MKMGGCIINFLKNSSFEKKNWSKMGPKFWKTDFRKLFFNKFYFFMSNLNVECFQLSFDIHIVHVGQKRRIFKNCSTES